MNILPLFLLITTTFAQYDTFSDSGDEDPEIISVDVDLVEESGCPPVIENLRNITLEELLGTWHIPYMSSHWVQSMAKPKYVKLWKRSSMGKFCVKVIVERNLNKPFSNTDSSLWFQFKCLHTGTEWNLACNPFRELSSKWYCNDLARRAKNTIEYTGDSYVYIADTDKKTWTLVVRCSPYNGMNWAIFSKAKHLNDTLVKSLFAKLEEMGFKLFNVVEVPYAKCITKLL